MRTGLGRAPGKVILAGEHFVVHGAPALALPLFVVEKQVRVHLDGAGTGRPQLDIRDDHGEQEHLAQMILRAVELLGVECDRITVEVQSTLPPGAHLGSSAALAVACLRALAEADGQPLADAAVVTTAYELERIVHGNPSGIDNTVVGLRRPVRFQKGVSPRTFPVALSDASLLVADTGVASSTARIVAAVGEFVAGQAAAFAEILARATDGVDRLEAGLARGDGAACGQAMNENQDLLAAIGTSSPELEGLVAAARDAGALGAKLTGAGGGGNMIALVASDRVEGVRSALEGAGRTRSTLELPLGDPR